MISISFLGLIISYLSFFFLSVWLKNYQICDCFNRPTSEFIEVASFFNYFSLLFH